MNAVDPTVRFVDKDTTEFPDLGLRVEPDPDMLGPRGAVYGYRVVRVSDGVEVYTGTKAIGCIGFCYGVAYAKAGE